MIVLVFSDFYLALLMDYSDPDSHSGIIIFLYCLVKT